MKRGYTNTSSFCNMCYVGSLYVKFTYYLYFLENMQSLDLLCKMNSVLLKLYLPIQMGLRALVCWVCGFECRRGKDVSRECCVFSGLYVGLITRP